MAFADLVREAGGRFVTEVSEMVVQEAGRAGEQAAQVFDLRLRSGESFLRDVPGIDRVAEPMGPTPPTPALNQVVQEAAVEAAATQTQQMEQDIQR